MGIKDLNALSVFAKVVEANSFSEAARRLNLPISTVSRRIVELENHLGNRLLERSTRNLRLTEFGAEVLEIARKSADLSDTVDYIISNKVSEISGALRLCTPPSISDSLIQPVVSAFQTSYPEVRVQVLITERILDYIAEEVDLAFKVGPYARTSLEARTLLVYRHQVVTSPAYLKCHTAPKTPHDLPSHRLLAFSFWKPEYHWTFTHPDLQEPLMVPFEPSLAINDYTVLIAALLGGGGIGELPPIVQPGLIRKGLLVELMPDWHLPLFELNIVHPRERHLPRHVRLFKDFASSMVPTLFADLPR